MFKTITTLLTVLVFSVAFSVSKAEAMKLVTYGIEGQTVRSFLQDFHHMLKAGTSPLAARWTGSRRRRASRESNSPQTLQRRVRWRLFRMSRGPSR